MDASPPSPPTTTTPSPSSSPVPSLPPQAETAQDDSFSWSHPDNLLTIGFSIFLLIGTCIWIWVWCKRGKFNKEIKPMKRKSKDKPAKSLPPTKPNERRDEALPGSHKTASLASIQSTGSNYYDQLMGSGNIPKVKSISQYGALLAQQEPPPP